MIIECPMCRARFRLDEAKIKGRGARVRCRRCGEAIVVLKPEEARTAPPPDAGLGLLDLRSVVRESLEETPPAGEPETHAAPPPSPGTVSEEPGSPSPPPVLSGEASAGAPLPASPSGETEELETAFEKFLASGGRGPAPESAETEPPGFRDLAVDFRPEERIVLDVPAEPPSAPTSPDFLIAGPEALDFLKEEYKKGEKGEKFDISQSLRQESRDLIFPTEVPQPPQSAGPDAAASAESAPTLPEPQVVLEGARQRPPEPTKTKKTATPFLRSSLAALVLLFVALAGGGAYLGFTKGGQELLRGLIPGMESLWLRGAGKTGPQFDVRNLIGYYEPRTSAGNLFVIKGQVANMGRTRKSGIRVHAELLDGKDQPVAARTSYAGNVLPGETLRTASREKIEEALSNRFGDKLINMDIAPGKSVPFMVVFFNAPEEIGAYRLEAKDGD
jgi:predicted Zn finger-like uncharacterized protein